MHVYFARKWDTHLGDGPDHVVSASYGLGRKKKGKAVVMLSIEEIDIAQTAGFGEVELIEMMRRSGWVRA